MKGSEVGDICSEVVRAGQDGTIVRVNSHVNSRVISQWLYLAHDQASQKSQRRSRKGL